jgi:hypothetical protein
MEVPTELAARIIDCYAHPNYREYLHRYVRDSAPGHIRHDLARCFALHRNFERYGTMLPDAAASTDNIPLGSRADSGIEAGDSLSASSQSHA